jgi:hypothetical protein
MLVWLSRASLLTPVMATTAGVKRQEDPALKRAFATSGMSFQTYAPTNTRVASQKSKQQPPPQ